MFRVVVFVTAVLLPITVQAQSSLQVPLQFDFLNPGARSMSLGSAFTAVADDATAAFANPAGLTLLSKPEVSIEGRGRRIASPFLLGGRLSGNVTNQGVDTVNGPVFDESVDSGGGVSFLSVVYPRPSWSIAAYRHELVRIDESYQTQGVFQRTIFSGAPTDLRELPQIGERSLDITNYGFAGGVKIGDKAAVGAGLSIYTFSIDSLFRRFATNGFYGAPDFSHELIRASQTGDDTAVAANVGVLLMPESRVRIGVTYKQGPKFDFSYQDASQPPGNGTFRVPDTVSVGAMVRATQAIAVSVDYSRVQYSQLEEQFITSQAGSSGRASNFVIDDGNEFHFGAEYTFVQSRFAPAVRAGAWYDPAHAVRYERSAANDTFDERFATALPGADNQMHVAFGGGVSVSQQFELNGAADITSKRSLVSVSAVFRF